MAATGCHSNAGEIGLDAEPEERLHSIVFELAAEMSGSSRAGGYASRLFRANAPSPPSPATSNQAAAGRGTGATQPLPPEPGPVVCWTCAAASNGPCPPAGVEGGERGTPPH